MSDLPEGAVLTSINGRKCTAVPRNVTNPEDIVTATNPPTADPSEDATAELPPGGILMEAPDLSREFPSLVSSIISSIPVPAPTESQPAPITSTPPGFRLAPDEDSESEDETEEEQPEDSAPTEDVDVLPTATPVSGEPASDDGEAEDGLPSPPSEESTEETEVPEDPTQEEADEEDNETSTPTPAPGIVEDGTTQSAGSPRSTDGVGSGIGDNGSDNSDGTDGTADEETDDGNGVDSDTGGDADDDSSSGGNESGSGSSDDRNGSNDDGNDDSSDEDDDEGGSGGGTGAVPSGTGDDFITTTLGDGVVTTIIAPPGNGQGSPTGGPDTDVVGSANDDGDDAKQAGIIAGSVIGSVAAVALVGALLFWFWRKKNQRHKYVIQTPVFEPPNSGRTEKTWDFDNGSIGPTNKTARMKEAVEYRFDAIGRKFSKPSPQPSRRSNVNINRGNSQFFAAGALPPRSRDNADIRPDNDELSNQDRLGNWWSRVREDANFNWGVRNDSPEHYDRSASARGLESHMDEGRDFSGTLGLMINDARSRGNDPFSDDYAVNRTGPSEGYAVHQTPPLRNPFDDANSVQPLKLAPASYDPRGQQRRSTTGSVRGHTPSALRQQASSPYQRSDTTTPLSRHQTNTPLSRGAVRSDQFDLEIEPHPGTLVAMPEEVSTREGTREGSMRSFTSRVSSLSDGDNYMRERGGDVGAAALRWADKSSPGIGKAS